MLYSSIHSFRSYIYSITTSTIDPNVLHHVINIRIWLQDIKPNLLVTIMLYPCVLTDSGYDFQLSNRTYAQFVIPNMMSSMIDVSVLEMPCN